ncbi:unnamed protein product [Zymoseptoria tritici ST99CH_1A5]|uniref:Ribosomal RNA-processing protein 17 n=3 Tax=Zymoseptoria tritici TaxID=1047171 RepID=A0A1X7RYQ8_ZYMT9|nr:unnamed protein product [Zymoseptoria tritici ST99CH_3D7]SMR55161.1 unnamed protein product [Zymoseptoria tritici ST99CH_1E4]SMR57536.1 unnamed protein product [Zymoseptoria tritici ST99CH_3D1]SMY25974.1 unnamed protein product [Zymoseptoria tritici ST99CH_1A5]
MAPPFKRRKIAPLSSQPAELTFDPSARQEYLSGFSKRKTARKEHAREQAIKRDKEEKVKERAQLREQRKEDLQQHVEAVNAVLREQNALANGDSDGDEDDTFDGFSEPKAPVVDESEAEYTDEEKYTTVTVSAMEAGNASDSSLEEEDAAKAAAAVAKAKEAAEAEALRKKKKRPWEKPWKGKDGKVIERPTQKKKKFRYESKAERSMTRMKQKSKNSAQAKQRKSAAD